MIFSLAKWIIREQHCVCRALSSPSRHALLLLGAILARTALNSSGVNGQQQVSLRWLYHVSSKNISKI